MSKATKTKVKRDVLPVVEEMMVEMNISMYFWGVASNWSTHNTHRGVQYNGSCVQRIDVLLTSGD